MIDYSFSIENLEFFLLIFIRISCFVYAAPFFSQKGVPNRVKVGFSIFYAILMYGVITERTIPEYNSIWGYGVLIMKEAMTGIFIGYAAAISTHIIGFAGRIIDMETGMSMANLIDPTTNEMSAITGVLYQYTVTLMLLISGMMEYVLKALAETFELIPVCGAVLDTQRLLDSIIKFLNDYMLIGFRICLPIFAIMLLLNAVLGIMTKVAPQVNMFAVGMQIKVLVGLVAMFLTVGLLPLVTDMVYTEVKKVMVSVVGSMM